MKRRKGSRQTYLARSDRSGFVFPATEMVTQWDGQFVHKSECEERNPQEFVRAKKDPEALYDVRVRPPLAQYCPLRYYQIGAPIGTAIIGTSKIGTTLRDNWPPGSIAGMSYGPNGVIFSPGIAASAADPNGMSIECTFQVYPD